MKYSHMLFVFKRTLCSGTWINSFSYNARSIFQNHASSISPKTSMYFSGSYPKRCFAVISPHGYICSCCWIKNLPCFVPKRIVGTPEVIPGNLFPQESFGRNTSRKVDFEVSYNSPSITFLIGFEWPAVFMICWTILFFYFRKPKHIPLPFTIRHKTLFYFFEKFQDSTFLHLAENILFWTSFSCSFMRSSLH